MDAIYIPQLARAPEQTESVSVDTHLSGLETLTPVQGEVRVSHCGNYLQVAGKAVAIVTLTCDRCLQQYNHRVVVDTSELIWLQKADADPNADLLEREVALEDLVETLDPEGYFQPLEWLYQQLCLAIPPRQLCDSNCQGISIQPDPPVDQLDQRWASLRSFKEHLQN